MKKLIIAAVSAIVLVNSIGTASAIDAKFRHKLERSGCTQVTEANGTCDVNKTKAQNAKAHPVTSLAKASAEAESVIGASISEGATALIEKGWKANNGEWHKGGHTLRLLVEEDVIVNAQLIK
ncbi:UNVERIFIED_CONTAM: hypothetical protein RF648_20690 [Kocuria sp. CPCC 205274]